jgi:hypothetical protein
MSQSTVRSRPVEKVGVQRHYEEHAGYASEHGGTEEVKKKTSVPRHLHQSVPHRVETACQVLQPCGVQLHQVAHFTGL